MKKFNDYQANLFCTSSRIRRIDQKHRKSSGYIEIIYFREIRSEIN